MEKLGNFISAFIKGKTPKVLYSEKAEGLHPYVSPDYLRGKGNPEFFAAMTNKTIPLEDDEIIILWDGSNAGEVLLSKKGILASTMVKLLVDETKLDKKYFAYSCLNLEYILKAKTAGSGIPHADKGVIKNLPFYFPTDKAEQTAIAKILSTVDEAIRSTRETISKLERVKKALMQNLLSGRMKPDGTLRTTDEFYEDEKMGLVPRGWKVVKLGSLFKIKAGGDLQEMFFSNCKDETHIYPVFSNSLDNKGLYGYTSNPRFFADESVTLTGRGNVGHSVYRQGDYDAIIRLISLIPLNPDAIDCRYITYFIDQFTHFSIESTGVPQLTCPRVFKTKIILPQNKNEQLEISQKISNIEIQIENKQAKITALESLKKSLMQQLLTGKVRVKC